ncbi:MAG TPA: ABC transporter ATP-binding protein [Comamonadaceae bacterium]|uniref:ABC transporter ATP-binding protein n=1 Tax=Pulveribacter sp. TaxID=2678893 RepID=UPI000ED62B55|nr:ABC transporter ATP-binding protein [Pulveribacter sp.]HCL85039.1 ABC transporter ATP-binding protein [Comamonadaceae bacterium]
MPPASATPSPDSAHVQLDRVTFGYGERVVLRELSLTVPRGKVTAIMGASGGGKTTVLRLIGGQHRAQSGRVLVDGQDVGAMDQAQLYAMRRRMGMLFQFGALFTDMSVFENVAFPLREHTDLPEALIRDVVLMKLGAVGLRGARELMPSQISGGMARRVALARAIALDPQLVMYDEPFAGLDPISLGTAAQLIRRLGQAMGLTSIVVSHDLEETFRLADHVIILGPGNVAAQGTPEEVRASEDPLVHQFVRALPTGPVPFHYPAASVAEDFGALP